MRDAPRRDKIRNVSDLLDTAALQLARVQRTNPVVRIRRSEINAAKYNPRFIVGPNAKRLGEGLKRFGLVSTLTWNKRSGVLVGGHQRLEQIDRDEKYSDGCGRDYLLDVSQVDLDEKEERELNVLLNNRDAQGEFDDDALAALIRDQDIGFDLQAAGFEGMSLQVMFDNPANDAHFALSEQNQETQDVARAAVEMVQRRAREAEEAKAARAAARTPEQEAERIDGIKAKKMLAKERLAAKDNHQFVALVTFADQTEQTLFVERVGADPAQIYVDGYLVLAALGITPPAADES